MLSVRTREWYGQLGCYGETGMSTEGCRVFGTGVFDAGGRQNDDGLGCVEELPCNVLVLEQKRWTLVLGGRCPLRRALELLSSFWYGGRRSRASR